jgi:hypothetical protein
MFAGFELPLIPQSGPGLPLSQHHFPQKKAKPPKGRALIYVEKTEHPSTVWKCLSMN